MEAIRSGRMAKARRRPLGLLALDTSLWWRTQGGDRGDVTALLGSTVVDSSSSLVAGFCFFLFPAPCWLCSCTGLSLLCTPGFFLPRLPWCSLTFATGRMVVFGMCSSATEIAVKRFRRVSQTNNVRDKGTVN